MQIESPADNYDGPAQFAVYKDNVYGTFLFVPTPGALRFVPTNPCRTVGWTALTGGVSQNFKIPGTCGVPTNAAAYSLNFTVVPNGPLGYLAAWPAGKPQPGTSVLNSDGRVKANAAIIPAGTGGAISVYASNDTVVIADINGYFVPASATGPGFDFAALTPCRVADTRSHGGPLSAGETRTFQIANLCGVPANANSYSLNVTVVPRGPLSYITLFPAGQAQPVVSTLNAPGGQVVANAATVVGGSGGAISVYATNATDLILDVNGYYGPGATYAFYVLDSPCREADTRFSSGAFGGTKAFPVSSSSCVFGANTVAAYALNATVVPQGALGFLSLYPDGSVWSGTSTLNTDGSVTSDLAIVPTTNGSIDALAAGGKTDLIIDIMGYFAP